MTGALGKSWWVLVLRGVLAIVFGLVCWLTPSMSIEMLGIVFGLYLTVEGVFSIVAATLWQVDHPWWSLLVKGVFGIAAGSLTFMQEDITPYRLLLLIGVYAIASGVLEVVASLRLRQDVTGEWVLGAAGAASIFFGSALTILRGAGALAVLPLIGTYAVTLGVLLIVTGLRIRSRLQGAVQDDLQKAA